MEYSKGLWVQYQESNQKRPVRNHFQREDSNKRQYGKKSSRFS